MLQRTAQSPQLHSVSSTNSSISPAPTGSFQQQNDLNQQDQQFNAPTEQDIMKCAHFFKSLLKMRPQQMYNMLDLKNLLREVLLGEQSPEEFTVKLREVTKSQDKGNLLPFLRKALPALRRSIQNGEHKDLRQSLDLDESSPTSQLPTPHEDEVQPEDPQHFHPNRPQKSGQQYQQVIFTDQQPLSNGGNNVVQQKLQYASMDNQQQQLTPQNLANSMDSQSLAVNVKDKDDSNQQQSSNDLSSIQFDQTAALDGADDNHEAEALLEDPAPIADNLNNLPHMLLNPQALADRILESMPNANGVDPLVLSTISNAAEARLRSILIKLAVLAEHRLEPRINPMYQTIDEPRKQLRFMEDIEKRAHENRQTAEKEALMKISKSKGKDKDTMEKAKLLQKADREEMVNREANAAAFAALGGSKIGMKRPFASNGAVPDWKNGLQNQGLGNGLTGTGRSARLKRVTMRDLQFFLGTDPSIPNNSRLRQRIALASLTMDENTSL